MNVNKLAISCRPDGQVLQSSNTSDMIFSVSEIISVLSNCMTPLPSIIVLTGTP
jgi:2-keto-4-pentenoate hydratase/2-oxohepta-3-ene-1,7-dioic acid hydratase in catechol pathway